MNANLFQTSESRGKVSLRVLPTLENLKPIPRAFSPRKFIKGGIMPENKSCCHSPQGEKPKNFFAGLLYGLLPHTFCIAFIVLSIIGATTAATLFKKFLLLPYFFEILIGLSLVFATISAVFYLWKNGSLSGSGIKNHWRYLSILYGITVAVNLLFFLVVFPLTANLNLGKPEPVVLSQKSALSFVTIQVQIPCSGHASLIIGELKKNFGVEEVKFEFPNRFLVSFNAQKITLDQILASEIFKSYPAKPL
jgi:hypothetical protein